MQGMCPLHCDHGQIAVSIVHGTCSCISMTPCQAALMTHQAVDQPDTVLSADLLQGSQDPYTNCLNNIE